MSLGIWLTSGFENMLNLKNLDEVIEVVKYNPEWSKFFIQEAQNIKNIFESNRLLGIEHYGSTSVPGLNAKPIVDILVGLNDFYISEQEKIALQKLGYFYFGKAAATQRIFLRKRCIQKYNLAVVLYDGFVWRDNLIIREYLKTHTLEAKKYSEVKEMAIKQGFITALSYSNFKRDFVMELVENARNFK